jgi:IS66 Orf2 like protein
MLSLPPSVRLFIAAQLVDGRKRPDSLMTLVRDVLGQDIFHGHLFVFFTRGRDRVRIVYWDHNGIAMHRRADDRSGGTRVDSGGPSTLMSPEDARAGTATAS